MNERGKKLSFVQFLPLKFLKILRILNPKVLKEKTRSLLKSSKFFNTNYLYLLCRLKTILTSPYTDEIELSTTE